MTIYDEVSAHHARLPGDVPRKAAGTHIGMFLAWALARDLGSGMHARRHADALAKLGRRWYTGRDYLMEALEGVLADEHLVDDGDGFAAAYYVSGGYARDYEETLRGTSPSFYHVRDDWSNYDFLAPVLDERFAAWKSGRLAAPDPAPEDASRTAVAAPVAPEEARAASRPLLEEPLRDEEPAAEPEPAPEPADVPAGLAEARQALHAALPETEVAAPEPAPSPPASAPDEHAASVQVHDPLRKRPSSPPEPPPPPPPPRQSPNRRKRRHRSAHTPIIFKRRPSRLGRGTRTKGTWFARILVGSLIVVALLAQCSQWTVRKSRRERKATAARRRFEEAHRRALARVRKSHRPTTRRTPRTPRTRPAPDMPAAVVVKPPKWPQVSARQAQFAERLKIPVQFENGLGMRFVLIPSGVFVMGSPPGEEGRHQGETAHNVVITRSFYMQITEVTNEQFRRFRPAHRVVNPAGLDDFDGAAMPVTSVDHESAQGFCDWLGGSDSRHRYRLPTEAEWEYACRAGTGTRFFWGHGENQAKGYANVADLTAKKSWPRAVRRVAENVRGFRYFQTVDQVAGLASVAQYKPNPWGLYDMLGNACEWCSDRDGAYPLTAVTDPQGPASGEYRLLRGGAFDTPVRKTRAAYRGGMEPKLTEVNLGFRVVSPVK